MNAGTEEPGSHAAVRAALQRARTAGKEETVIYHLRATGGAAPTSAETKKLAGEVLQRAAGASGLEPTRKTIFENLGSMAVQGDPDLLLRILGEPEIHAASMNSPEDGGIELIRPVRKSPAKADGWVDAAE